MWLLSTIFPHGNYGKQDERILVETWDDKGETTAPPSASRLENFKNIVN
jgi:hypothetical protein